MKRTQRMFAALGVVTGSNNLLCTWMDIGSQTADLDHLGCEHTCINPVAIR